MVVDVPDVQPPRIHMVLRMRSCTLSLNDRTRSGFTATDSMPSASIVLIASSVYCTCDSIMYTIDV